MSRKFLTNIDLNSNELRNGVIHNLATDPGSGAEGQIYFNTADKVLKVYSGVAWEAVGSVEFIGDSVNELLVAGAGVSLVYDDEAGTLTVENTGVTSVTGTANEVTVSASTGGVTIGLPGSITADVVGNVTGNASTATALETARTISLGGSLSGDVVFDGTSDVTIVADLVANSVVLGVDTAGDYVQEVVASGDGILVTGTGEGASVTIENTGVTSVQGTANEVTVSAASGLVVIGLPDDVTIGGSLIVSGDLTVSGSVTTLNTETLLVEDNQITLNSNVTGTPVANAGLEVERGSETNASFVWDESTDKWSAGLIGSETAVPLKYAENNESLSSTGGICTWTVSHNLSTKDVNVQVYEVAADYSQVEVDVQHTSIFTVTIKINSSTTINADTYRVVVVG